MTTNTVDIPSIAGPDFLCSADTYTLQNFPVGSTATWSVTPSWQFTGATSGSSTTATLTPSSRAAGQATLTYTITTACGNTQVQRVFWVGEADLNRISFSNPVDEFEYFCSSDYGNTFTIHSNSPNTTWQARMLNWPSLTVAYTSPSTYQSNQSYIWSYVPIPNNGYYVFEVRGTNACGTTDWLPGYEIEYVDCTSFGEDPFLIYPNPASDIVTISLGDIIDSELSKSTQFEVSLYNQQGQMIIDNTKVEQEIVLNTSGLKNGFYYVHIRFKDELIRRQVRIER